MQADDLSGLRRNYEFGTLSKAQVHPDPIIEFKQWLTLALHHDREVDANAMMLATVNPDGQPSARVVLLKDVDSYGFTFFTNYHSRKGRDLRESPKCAATFWWPHLHRQVRIEGVVSPVSEEKAIDYFNNRPEGSQMGAIISPQSEVIPNRQYLEDKLQALSIEVTRGKSLKKPPHWGGYLIEPTKIEFWQGRENRLHDRIRYTRSGDTWKIERLSP